MKTERKRNRMKQRKEKRQRVKQMGLGRLKVK